MTPDSQEESAPSQPSVHSNICRFAGCDLNWERRLGYFKTTTTKSTFQFGIGGKRCPVADHGFLAVSAFPVGGCLWMCLVDNCNHTEFHPEVRP